MLRVPYLTVKLAGRDVPTADYTEDRHVGQTRLSGYISEAKLRLLLAEGGTLLFNNVEQWIGTVGGACKELTTLLQSNGGATLFSRLPAAKGWNPTGTRRMYSQSS